MFGDMGLRFEMTFALMGYLGLGIPKLDHEYLEAAHHADAVMVFMSSRFVPNSFHPIILILPH